jgi:hypothetical protein
MPLGTERTRQVQLCSSDFQRSRLAMRVKEFSRQASAIDE